MLNPDVTESLRKALNLEHITTLSKNDSGYDKYVHLERGAPGSPVFAIVPKNEVELQKAILLLNTYKCSAVIYAGGTGLVSAQRSVGQAVIDLHLLHQLKALQFSDGTAFRFSDVTKNPLEQAEIWRSELSEFIKTKPNDYSKNAIIISEAGVPMGTINFVLEAADVMVPIETGAVAVGGGMTAGAGAANASHGATGLTYGSLAEQCVWARAINGNGTIRQDIGLDAIKDRSNEKQTIIDSAILPLGDSAIGSQGTFAIITELAYKTQLLPKQQHMFMIQFETAEDFWLFRKEIVSRFGKCVRQIEMVDGASFNVMTTYNKEKCKNLFPQNTSAAFYMIVELTDIRPYVAEDSVGLDFYTFLESKQFAEGSYAYEGDMGTPVHYIPMFRHSISEASSKFARTMGEPVHHRVTFDLSVPLASFADFIKDITAAINRMELTGILFGHAGVGAFHLHVFSKEDVLKPREDGSTLKQAIMDAMFSITQSYAGSCWSEHGIGTLWGDEWQKRTPKKFVNEWFEAKRKNDPNNILNPNSNGFREMFASVDR